MPAVKAIGGQLSTVTEMFEAVSFVDFQGFTHCLTFLVCNDWNYLAEDRSLNNVAVVQWISMFSDFVATIAIWAGLFKAGLR